MLIRFLYRNKTEVATCGYTASELSQTARKGCHHITDILKRCDMSSCALLSIRFITELQYHDLVTSLFTVEKLRKIYKSYTSKF